MQSREVVKTVRRLNSQSQAVANTIEGEASKYGDGTVDPPLSTVLRQW